MSPRTRAAALAVAALAVLTAGTACSASKQGGSSSVAADGAGYGTLPAASGTPKEGGVVKVAESPGAGPNYIFPVTPAANGSVYNSYQFQDILWRPLYASQVGVEPKVDLKESLAAEAPTFSADNKTVTIPLKQGWTWSDGKPVVAADLVFYIDLVKAAVAENSSNFSNYTPGMFPDSVTSAVATDPHTLTMTLDKAFNPQFFALNQAALLIPLPSTAWNRAANGGPAVDYTTPAGAKAVYDYLAGQAKDLTTYATNPLWQVIDGAFGLASYDASTSAFTIKKNPRYSGPQKSHLDEVDFVSFTSETAEFDQLRSGTLDVGAVPFTDLPQVPRLKQAKYDVYGYPAFGFQYVVYNFHNTTGAFASIIKQLYVRQALAHLQDEQAVIKGVFKGAGAASYGPVPAVPKSQYTPANATKNPYPHDVAAAKKLLTDHGWKVVPNGTTTCASPGTGANQCGDGIPAGTKLSWNLLYANSPASTEQQVTAFASAAKQLGITITTASKTFNYLINNYSVASAKSTINDWAMMDFGGFSISTYPTTNQIFNTDGSYNEGGYADPKADQLIKDSVYGSDAGAVSKEASYLTEQLPAMFQPNPDNVLAWKNTLSGPPGSFSTWTQYRISPEYWYLKK